MALSTECANLPSDFEVRIREASIAFGEKAVAKQFANRKGHGGNPLLAERHLSRQQLIVLMAAAFEAGAEYTKSKIRP